MDYELLEYSLMMIPFMQVFRPYLQSENINALTYECFLADRSFSFSSSKLWIQPYYKKGLFSSSLFVHHKILAHQGLISWQDLTNQIFLQDLGIDSQKECFTYFVKLNTRTHLFHFVKEKDEKNLSLSKVKETFFKSFALTFLQNTENIRNRGESLAINAGSPKLLTSSVDILALHSSSCISNKFLPQELTVISSKEAIVAKKLLDGFSLKQISLELRISERAVKYHIYSLKEKMDCKTLLQLGVRLSNLYIAY